MEEEGGLVGVNGLDAVVEDCIVGGVVEDPEVSPELG